MARIVSGTGGGSSNSRTPNSKKKFQQASSSGLASTVLASMMNQPSQKRTSGQNTSRQSTGMGQTIGRTSANFQAHPNATFDFEEHIRNVIKSVERRNQKRKFAFTIRRPRQLEGLLGASARRIQDR